jgi:hypothetical protein
MQRGTHNVEVRHATAKYVNADANESDDEARFVGAGALVCFRRVAFGAY